MYICLSPGGQSITVGETPRKNLLVGTVNGIFSFTGNGREWVKGETMLPAQHISSILFEPASRTLFAGTYNGKIFASSDNGKSWEERTQGIVDREIYSLATQIVNGRPRVYAGTQPAHLYFSDDLGKS